MDAGRCQPRGISPLEVILQPTGTGDTRTELEQSECAASRNDTGDHPNKHDKADRASIAIDVAGRGNAAGSNDFVDCCLVRVTSERVERGTMGYD